MNLIFICSYLSVTDVIDTIENEGSDFMILTSDKGLQKLFSELYSSSKVLKLPKLCLSIKPFSTFMSDLILLPFYKRKILNKCKEINPKKIIFYYIGWNGFESWLIKRLSKVAQVFHRPKVDMRAIKSNNLFKQAIKTYIFSFIYGIKFKSASFHNYPTITIDKSFLKLVGAKRYDHIFNPKNIRKFISNRFVYSNNIKVLILIGGEYNLDRDKYNSIMENIYISLVKHYKSSEIGIKNHPNFPSFNASWAKDSIIIDKLIPASLLCYTSEIVIAYGSAVLYEAADIGKRAISTAYMIPTKIKGSESNLVQYLLDNSKSKIYFPICIDEFNDLVKV